MTGYGSVRCVLGSDRPLVVVIDRRLDFPEIIIDFDRICGSAIYERMEGADRVRCHGQWCR
jgi:hypothetical protein